MSPLLSRRAALKLGAAALPTLAFGAEPAKDKPVRGKPTNFQIACMTLPYSAFPLDRALERPQVRRLPVRRLGNVTQGRWRQVSPRRLRRRAAGEGERSARRSAATWALSR